MPAKRKKTTVRRAPKSSSVINKDLFVFIIIVGILAIITYVLTYNAINAKMEQQLMPSSSYQMPQ